MTEQQTAIVATPVPEDKRLSILPEFFGFSQMLKAESLVYAWMSKLSIDYTGGHWEFYRLSNGGFYMAPSYKDAMRIVFAENHYEGLMSADAAGLTATLFAVNHLANTLATDKMIDLYYQIRDFAIEHGESKAILRAID